MSLFAELFVLFLGIFDPLMSLVVFVTLAHDFNERERRSTAILAVLVAATPLVLSILFGLSMLNFLNIQLQDFQVAGGIILGILGIKMALGIPLIEKQGKKVERSTRAVAVLIGTPLLTGPAIITTAIVSSNENGVLLTAAASLSALAVCLVTLLSSKFFFERLGPSVLQVCSTLLGLVTLAWGVQFIRAGLGV